MKLILKTSYFLFLLFIGYNSFAQKNNLDRVAVTKKVRLLDSTQFVYIVNEKGANFLTFICKDDMKDFTGFLMISYDAAMKKDAKVKDLPYIPEGEYLFWNEIKHSWESKKGTLNDVLKIISQ